MQRILALVAAVSALCALLALGWASHLTSQNKRLGERAEALAADLDAERNLRTAERLVATRQAQRLAALTTKQRETHARLQSAISASPGWAAERVPADVAAVLGLHDSAPDTPSSTTE